MVWIPDIVLYNRYFFQKVFNNYTLIKKTLKNNKYKHADLLYMFQSVENLSLIHVSSSPYIPRG